MAARWVQCARLIMAAAAVAACLLTTADESMLRQLHEAVPHQLNPDLLQQVCVCIYSFPGRAGLCPLWWDCVQVAVKCLVLHFTRHGIIHACDNVEQKLSVSVSLA